LKLAGLKLAGLKFAGLKLAEPELARPAAPSAAGSRARPGHYRLLALRPPVRYRPNLAENAARSTEPPKAPYGAERLRSSPRSHSRQDRRQRWNRPVPRTQYSAAYAPFSPNMPPPVSFQMRLNLWLRLGTIGECGWHGIPSQTTATARETTKTRHFCRAFAKSNRFAGFRPPLPRPRPLRPPLASDRGAGPWRAPPRSP
jgi:hypothetical protein